MKIVSRPTPDGEFDECIGSGENKLRLTDEQLTLVMALIAQCRLGNRSPYQSAAFELMTEIEEALDDVDVFQAASELVNLQVTIEDDNGSHILTTDPSNYVTLEV